MPNEPAEATLIRFLPSDVAGTGQLTPAGYADSGFAAQRISRGVAAARGICASMSSPEGEPRWRASKAAGGSRYGVIRSSAQATAAGAVLLSISITMGWEEGGGRVGTFQKQSICSLRSVS